MDYWTVCQINGYDFQSHRSLKGDQSKKTCLTFSVTCVHLPFSSGCCSCSLVPLVEVVWVLSLLVSFLLYYPSVGHMLLLLQTATPLPPSAAVRLWSVWLLMLLFVTSCRRYHSKDNDRRGDKTVSISQVPVRGKQQQSGSARLRNFIKGFLFTSCKWHLKIWKG